MQCYALLELGGIAYLPAPSKLSALAAILKVTVVELVVAAGYQLELSQPKPTPVENEDE